MTKKKKLALFGCGCFGPILGLGLAVIYLLNSNEIDNALPFKRAEMWKITQEWGSIPDLPAEATDFNIRTEGNGFTRTFVSEFNAPADVITTWLASFVPEKGEPMVSGNAVDPPDNPRVEADGNWIYEFRFDRGGYGIITVSEEGTHVNIRVSWS